MLGTPMTHMLNPACDMRMISGGLTQGNTYTILINRVLLGYVGYVCVLVAILFLSELGVHGELI